MLLFLLCLLDQCLGDREMFTRHPPPGILGGIFDTVNSSPNTVSCFNELTRYEECFDYHGWWPLKCQPVPRIKDITKRFLAPPDFRMLQCASIEVNVLEKCPGYKIMCTGWYESMKFYVMRKINCHSGLAGTPECLDKGSNGESDCLTGTGAGYRGTTSRGYTYNEWRSCMDWPINDEKVVRMLPDVAGYTKWSGLHMHFSGWGIEPHNYCRNPNNLRPRPWCFVAPEVAAECLISECNDPNELNPNPDQPNGIILTEMAPDIYVYPGKVDSGRNPFARIETDEADFTICPPNLPFAFLYGNWCCQNNVEDNWELSMGIVMADCNGGPLEYLSVCCLGDVYETCEAPPCLSNPSVSGIGAAEYVTRPPNPIYTASRDGIIFH